MAETPVRKFMFDRSFDEAVGKGPVRDRRPVTFSYEQLEKLKKETHDAGFAAGKKAGGEEQTARLNAMLARLTGQVERLLSGTEAARAEDERRVREAVLVLAKKVLPDYARRNGLEEINAVVAGIVGELTGEPRLVVRVNEAQFDVIDTSLKEITEKQGFAGKFVLMADAAVAADDCLIEWADGGLERNAAALWQAIGKSVAPGVALPPVTESELAAPVELAASTTPTAPDAPADAPAIPQEETSHG